MEISRKQALLGGFAAFLVVVAVAAVIGALGGLVGYAVGSERLERESVSYAPLVASDVYSAGPGIRNVPELFDRPGDGLREWVAELEDRITVLEIRADSQLGMDGEQLLPLLLMMLGAIFDGGWYGYDGMVSPGYPEESEATEPGR